MASITFRRGRSEGSALYPEEDKTMDPIMRQQILADMGDVRSRRMRRLLQSAALAALALGFAAALPVNLDGQFAMSKAFADGGEGGEGGGDGDGGDHDGGGEGGGDGGDHDSDHDGGESGHDGGDDH